MKNPLRKRMSDHVLSSYTLWLVIIGCVLTGAGAFFQYLKEKNTYAKELDATQEALKTEKRRVAEHDTLQQKSNALLSKTENVLNDTKLILDDTKALLSNAEVLLKASDLTIQQQASTIKRLDGSDSIPVITVRVEPFLVSYTQFSVVLAAQLKDEYPLVGLSIKSFFTSDSQIQEEINSFKNYNDAIDDIIQKDLKHQFESPINLPPGRKRFLKEFHVKYPSQGEKIYFYVQLKWPKGFYQLNFELMFNDFKPTFKVPLLKERGDKVPPISVHNINFSNGYNDQNIYDIKRNLQKDQQLEFLREMEKRNQKPK